jgi:hypothetical protein
LPQTRAVNLSAELIIIVRISHLLSQICELPHCPASRRPLALPSPQLGLIEVIRPSPVHLRQKVFKQQHDIAFAFAQRGKTKINTLRHKTNPAGNVHFVPLYKDFDGSTNDPYIIGITLDPPIRVIAFPAKPASKVTCARLAYPDFIQKQGAASAVQIFPDTSLAGTR